MHHARDTSDGEPRPVGRGLPSLCPSFLNRVPLAMEMFRHASSTRRGVFLLVIQVLTPPPLMLDAMRSHWIIWDHAKLFPDMPCMKRLYRDKSASVHWSAARNEERFSSC